MITQKNYEAMYGEEKRLIRGISLCFFAYSLARENSNQLLDEADNAYLENHPLKPDPSLKAEIIANAPLTFNSLLVIERRKIVTIIQQGSVAYMEFLKEKLRTEGKES